MSNALAGSLDHPALPPVVPESLRTSLAECTGASQRPCTKKPFSTSSGGPPHGRKIIMIVRIMMVVIIYPINNTNNDS